MVRSFRIKKKGGGEFDVLLFAYFKLRPMTLNTREFDVLLLACLKATADDSWYNT